MNLALEMSNEISDKNILSILSVLYLYEYVRLLNDLIIFDFKFQHLKHYK